MALTVQELAPFANRGRRRRPSRGLGYFIPDSPRAPAAKWGLPNAAQELAPGFSYAHPFAAQSAYLDRSFNLLAPFYTGEDAQAKHWTTQNAALYPQLQLQLPPWLAQFPMLQQFQQAIQQPGYSQPMWNMPSIPIYGEGWSINNPSAKPLPVASPSGYAQGGQPIERF